MHDDARLNQLILFISTIEIVTYHQLVMVLTHAQTLFKGIKLHVKDKIEDN